MTNPALKACPFCGGKAKWDKAVRKFGKKYASTFKYGIICTKCCVCTGFSGFKESTLKRWNTRQGEKNDRQN